MCRYLFVGLNYYKLLDKQECLPVGCVPSVSVAIFVERGVLLRWCLPRRRCVSPRGCLPRRGVCLPRGFLPRVGVSVQGMCLPRGCFCPEVKGCTPPPVDRQTAVKT